MATAQKRGKTAREKYGTGEETSSARVKYGEELRLRRERTGMTQEELSEILYCSASLISHIEAGRRLPTVEDAKRIDKALGADGWFERWLKDLEPKYADHFQEAAELEKHAKELRMFSPLLVPGLLQTEEYARAIYAAYRPNHTPDYLDGLVVNRIERSRLLDDPENPVVWSLLDEAVLHRRVGGPGVMAQQLTRIADIAASGRLRIHVLPYGAGAHALMEGAVTLMSFPDTGPAAYVEGLATGRVVDSQREVDEYYSAYDLALSDAMSQQQSLARIRAVAEEHGNAH
ncbi:helix-turn-helix transcriptional regulator [Streptomyces sp. HNM0574]|uniref:helix-turn-helix domain-containing protein n=1 Tax=Streptomyces sp. HNM0574 TaxID=2714954 RepID=UPI00146E1245|nr:helix-turn-helix transcriptional regulator [Streptomyces sp. HNM0574]NLU68916.1 helix-turn-helix domain-containing protein [Streptomyces sp. HNM0574]